MPTPTASGAVAEALRELSQLAAGVTDAAAHATLTAVMEQLRTALSLLGAVPKSPDPARSPFDSTPPVTHVYCGAEAPWSPSLGDYRHFTSEELLDRTVCRPLDTP